jgi:hypothetical protein
MIQEIEQTEIEQPVLEKNPIITCLRCGLSAFSYEEVYQKFGYTHEKRYGRLRPKLLCIQCNKSQNKLCLTCNKPIKRGRGIKQLYCSDNCYKYHRAKVKAENELSVLVSERDDRFNDLLDGMLALFEAEAYRDRSVSR